MRAGTVGPGGPVGLVGLVAGVVAFTLAACSGGVSIGAFEKVAKKTCACTTAACVAALPADVRHLQTLGSEPAPECRADGHCDDRATTEARAKKALDNAYACAVRLDPNIGAKVKAALAE